MNLEALARGNGQNLRLLAYHPVSEPDERLSRFVVQFLEEGRPVAERPIVEALATDSAIQAFLVAMEREGWSFESWRAPVLPDGRRNNWEGPVTRPRVPLPRIHSARQETIA